MCEALLYQKNRKHASHAAVARTLVLFGEQIYIYDIFLMVSCNLLTLTPSATAFLTGYILSVHDEQV